MKIVADDNISLLEELFSSHGEIVSLPGREISARDVRDADVLLVRSVTGVNAELLAGSRVKYVGSCTIGTDHLDTAWLEQQGIHWKNASGCNAEAVVDYVLACLFTLDIFAWGSDVQRLMRGELTVGVVGCGNVGSRLAKRLQKMGVSTLCCDPFKRSKKYMTLDEMIPQCDIVCLHTPLTRTGKHPTFHLINEHNLPCFKDNAILLNAGRGAVIDNVALLEHLNHHPRFRAVLDVWENEPEISTTLLQAATIATPHIAGYSVEGKRRGTEMIYKNFCQYFNVGDVNSVSQEEPLEFDATHFSSLRELILACYDPRKDSEELKHAPQSFDQLRKLYVYRREFSQCRLRRTPRELKSVLRALGFRRF